MAAVAVGSFVAAGCGGASSPSPTQDRPDKGECIDLTGPDDDITMTVVACPSAGYEVLDVVGVLYPEAECPPGTHLELDRTVQFLRPGQTAGPTPGGMHMATYCLRDRALPTTSAAPTAPPLPSPTVATAASVSAHDVKYTSQTGRGDPITVTLTLDNDGDAASDPISFEIGGLADHADVVGCTPSCGVEAVSGGWVLTFADGVAAGGSDDYEVELVSSRTGSITWRLTIFAGSSNQVFTGTGTTDIE